VGGLHERKVLLSWSSGKDCALALHRLRQTDVGRVVGLLTTVNEMVARVSIHGVRLELLRAQADRLSLPLIEVPLPDPCSNEVYEERLGGALDQAKRAGVSSVAFGDIHLQDVREYRERQLAKVGLDAIFPIFGRPSAEVAREQIETGFRALITCVDSRRLPACFAGREFDRRLLDQLPSDVDPCGEGGEFHTLVTWSPGFSRPIPVVLGAVVERGGFVYQDVLLGPPGSGSSAAGAEIPRRAGPSGSKGGAD